MLRICFGKCVQTVLLDVSQIVKQIDFVIFQIPFRQRFEASAREIGACGAALRKLQCASVFAVFDDTAQAAFFYDNLFGEELPLSIHFEKAEGPDLQVSPDQTWDLEILEFKVAEDYDLVALHDKLEKEQFSSYLDSKGNLLALTDMSNIEVWFTK